MPETTTPMLPGEYECELEQRDCRSALRFARELWSREFVLKYVAPAVLLRSSAHAALHRGHVVVRIDNVPVTGLSMRRFTELWVPDGSTADVSTTHVVRMCNRRRAEVETAILKDLTPHYSSSTSDTTSTKTESVQPATPRDIADRIAQCQTLLWSHRLQDVDHSLQYLVITDRTVDPLVLVTRLELALVRVLLSNDAHVVTHARQTAKQTLTWLQALVDLSTLSAASALALRVALAETQLLATALAFIADRPVQGVNEFRRCASAYAALHLDLTQSNDDVDAKVPRAMLADLQSRVRFGLGMLQLACATAAQGPEWLGALVHSVGCEPTQALDNLLASCYSNSTAIGDCEAKPRAAWASLALFHCASAVRLVQQQQCDARASASTTYRRDVALAQHQSLQQFPNSVLHLWAASLNTVTTSTNSEAADKRLARAVALAQHDERAHLLRFDAGFRRFVALDLDASTPLFTAICKCASAPSKLRGLCSMFLAATDVFVAYVATTSDALASSATNHEQLFGSVRLLLRAALRFFDDVRTRDAEAACLAQRVRVLLGRADWALHLLPIEMLYVYCASFTSRSRDARRCSQVDADAACPALQTQSTQAVSSASAKHQNQHARALAFLDGFVVQGVSVAAMGLLQSTCGKVVKLNTSNHARSSTFSLEALALCEWSVLRASVLVQLGALDRAQQQLATLHELLPLVPAGSFVPLLAACYELEIRLQQRLGDTVGLTDAWAADAVAPVAVQQLAAAATSSQLEYGHIYVARLRALLAVWAKTAAS